MTTVLEQKPADSDSNYSGSVSDEDDEYEAAKKVLIAIKAKRAKRNPEGGGRGGGPPDPPVIIAGVSNGTPLTREQLVWHRILVEFKFD